MRRPLRFALIGIFLFVILNLILHFDVQKKSNILSSNNNNINYENEIVVKHNHHLNTTTTSFPSSIPKRQNATTTLNKNNNKIRKWGCQLTETPLIFVHIGKAGGGTIRSKIATASFNYTRGRRFWRTPDMDDSYYPLKRTTTTNSSSSSSFSRAYFCNSAHFHYRPVFQKTHEGTLLCNSSTPIGMALSCPSLLKHRRPCRGCPVVMDSDDDDDDKDESPCRIVYTGHNFLGSEMHWLPWKMLLRWWRFNWVNGDKEGDLIGSLWYKLLPVNGTHFSSLSSSSSSLSSSWWCQTPQRNWTRPRNYREYNKLYRSCSIPLQKRVDDLTIRKFTNTKQWLHNNNNNNKNKYEYNFNPSKDPWQGAIYASLPVLRIIVVREPFSWFVSSYFWNPYLRDHTTCDDIIHATSITLQEMNGTGTIIDEGYIINNRTGTMGWARRFSLFAIFAMCGEDCLARYYYDPTTLSSLIDQAEYNLRNSFAVVGIATDIHTFYDMTMKRVQYMENLPNGLDFNAHKMKGNKTKDKSRCSAVFEMQEFQRKMIEKSLEVRGLVRLYKVALEVHDFQRDELDECQIT